MLWNSSACPPSQVLRAEMMVRISSEPTQVSLIAQPYKSILAGGDDFYQRYNRCCRCLARFYCVCSTWAASYHQSSAFTQLPSIIESENMWISLKESLPKSLLIYRPWGKWYGLYFTCSQSLFPSGQVNQKLKFILLLSVGRPSALWFSIRRWETL